MDNFAAIPPTLRADLDALRPILEKQGCVQTRRDPDRLESYRLRFREFNTSAGFTQQRNINLGRDPALADDVRSLVRGWQERFQATQRTAARAPTSPGPHSQDDPARRIALLLAGGDWRRQKQIGEWYDKAHQNPAEMLRFVCSHQFPAPRKAGRPPKSRLW